MRALVQRVKGATVKCGDNIVSRIDDGLLVFLGIKIEDGEKDAEYLAEKIVKLRIFNDENGNLNLSVMDKGYSILVVSQFTLYADCRKGTRPSFSDAMPKDEAKILYDKFIEKLKKFPLNICEGIFGGYMQITLINDGPVTVILDSK